MILFPSQERIMQQAKPSWFYNLSTSSGKSLISIYHYLKHRKDEPLLIVCPPSKKKSMEWDAEIEKVEQHENVKINYEIVASSMLAKQYINYRNYFVVYDEAHEFKNSQSKRGKAAFKLSQMSTNFILLTATAGEDWADFINYFLMWRFYKNKTQFLKEHAEYENLFLGNRTIKKIAGFRDEEKIEGLWRSISVSKKADYFVDLPTTSEKVINFSPAPIYNKAKKERVVELDGDEQILDTPTKLASTLRYLTNQKAKIDYLKMLFESTKENIVVFYQFKRERLDILDVAQKLKKTIYEVNGQNFVLPTKEEKDCLEDSVTIVQIQSGSTAIELKYASIVVYQTPSYSFSQYQQSRGRAVRHGGSDHVTFYKFNTVGTIEEKVWQALDNKKDFDEKLFAQNI